MIGLSMRGKTGTNIPGATSTSLILSNLQLTDTATNGGYRLLGINVSGTNSDPRMHWLSKWIPHRP